MKINFIALSNQYLNITETTMKILIYKIKLPKPQLGQDLGTQSHIPENIDFPRISKYYSLIFNSDSKN